MKVLSFSLILFFWISSSKAQSVDPVLTTETISRLPQIEEVKQIKRMAGTYGECVMACSAIRINPDMTFDSYLSGDLWPTIRLKGTLKHIGKSTVLANSTRQPTRFPTVVESSEGDETVFTVQVFDAVAATYPGIRIRGKSNGLDFDVETDERGTATIPTCDQFTYVIPWLRQSWNHKVSLEKVNRFIIRISEDQMHPELFVINQKWMIKNRTLYFVDENGRASESGMKRVSKRQEREFFPEE
jgi:hypothetical protein